MPCQRSPFYKPANAILRLIKNPRGWQLILVALAVPLALIAFWPTPVDQAASRQFAAILTLLHCHGVPTWFNYKFVEAAANVVIFLPVGFVAALGFPSKRWWQIGAFGLLVSGSIELGQLLFLHDRFASPSDIMTNTTGAVIGALLATLATKKGGPLPFGSRPPKSARS